MSEPRTLAEIDAELGDLPADAAASYAEPSPFHEPNANDSQPAEPFPGLTHDEVLTLEVSDERYLVRDLVPVAAVGTIAGVPETYKSWLAQQIAVSVAKGEGTVLGCDIAAAAAVGYFWQDDSTREEVERVKTYEHANTAAGTTRLRWFLNQGVQLPGDIGRLAATIRTFELRLVVLDSFYNFLPGVNLKDEDAERIVALLKRDVADALGCTVLLVDHMPWPTETNRQRLRAYGGVFKNAATRFGIYVDAVGKNLLIEARGNNIRGFRRRPAYWDVDALELRLVQSATADERDAAEADALAWIVEHVTSHHTKTGAGIARGRVEEAFHAAHDGHGRNLARRAIDHEIALADRILADPDRRDTGETPPRLATAPGETRHGKYLIPFNHALSPLAATLSGDTGETGARPPQETALAGLAAPLYREGQERRDQGEGGDSGNLVLLGDPLYELEVARAVDGGHLTRDEGADLVHLHRFVEASR